MGCTLCVPIPARRHSLNVRRHERVPAWHWSHGHLSVCRFFIFDLLQLCFEDASHVWDACSGLVFANPFRQLDMSSPETFVPEALSQIMAIVFQTVPAGREPGFTVQPKGDSNCYSLPGLRHGSASCPSLPAFSDALATYACVGQWVMALPTTRTSHCCAQGWRLLISRWHCATWVVRAQQPEGWGGDVPVVYEEALRRRGGRHGGDGFTVPHAGCVLVEPACAPVHIRRRRRVVCVRAPSVHRICFRTLHSHLLSAIAMLCLAACTWTSGLATMRAACSTQPLLTMAKAAGFRVCSRPLLLVTPQCAGAHPHQTAALAHRCPSAYRPLAVRACLRALALGS